jgi:hypothetical protein
MQFTYLCLAQTKYLQISTNRRRQKTFRERFPAERTPLKAVAITPRTTITGVYVQWGVSEIVILESRLYSHRP